ncbi:MAG: SAF domain-containing protein [Propionicimonas sp.]
MQWLSSSSPLRRALRWHRRLLAAGFAALAVYCVLAVLTGRDDTTVVVAAAGTIPGGSPVVAADLTLLRLPRIAVPEGALTSLDEAIGRTVVAPVPARGVLTAAAFSSSGELVAAGRLAVPVTLEDTAAVGLLAVGDLLDLLGTGSSGTVVVLAQDARVVALPTTGTDGLLGSGTVVVVVDLSREEATRVVAAAGSPLGFALH